MPSGKYWIGDPCYIYPDNCWGEFCDNLYTDNVDNCPFITKEGIFVNGTEYGDDCYLILKNNRQIGELGVDAGLLALVPLTLAETFDKYYEKYFRGTVKDLGIIVDISENFKIKVISGDFSFLDYEVKTSGFDEEENEEEENFD